NVMTHGTLVAKGYDVGKNYRGIAGLYGSYDYIAPQTFRVSSTALSLGTTAQYRFTDLMQLLATARLGLGYTAVGTIRSTAENDFHYGVTPQALVNLRLIFGGRAAIDVTGREYYVSRVAAADRAGAHRQVAAAPRIEMDHRGARHRRRRDLRLSLLAREHALRDDRERVRRREPGRDRRAGRRSRREGLRARPAAGESGRSALRR